MRVDTESPFEQAIQEHLELKARNASLENAMPLVRYEPEDPFENHPLFKSEEQARLEETLDGTEPAVAEPEVAASTLPWPGEDSEESLEGPALDESLWGRPRDFDWGD